MSLKRIALIIGFFSSVLVFAFLLYYFFFKSEPVQPPVNLPGNTASFPTVGNGTIGVINAPNLNINLPNIFGQPADTPSDVARGGLTNVVDHNIVNPRGFVRGADGSYYYDTVSGLFFNFDGQTSKKLSDQKFFNVDTITWSKQRDRVILEYPDSSNIVYDFRTNTQISLPQELYNFSFDASGKNLAGKWQGDEPAENWLMVGNADSSNFRLIEPLGDNAEQVDVDFAPNNQVVALFSKARDNKTQTILPIGLQGENFKSFTVDGLSFESSWSTDGGSLLYSAAAADDNYLPRLWVTSGNVDSLGAFHVDLELNTWSNKCAFSATGTSVYCAEPLNLPRGAGLFPEVAAGTPDAFYRIDLDSGRKIPLAFPVGNQSFYSADTVFLSPDESQLYFVDANTNRLQSIRLK